MHFEERQKEHGRHEDEIMFKGGVVSFLDHRTVRAAQTQTAAQADLNLVEVSYRVTDRLSRRRESSGVGRRGQERSMGVRS